MPPSPTAAPVVEVKALRKTYRDGWLRSRQVDALRGVDLAVQPGEIFGLIGPNGAGKTTLVKILLGVVRRTAGEARLLGMPAGDAGARRRVGYLPEGHRIPRHHTANTALEYYGGLSRLTAREIRARRPALLQRLGLKKAADRSVRGYSKGMLQRLGLAQALLHEPDLLFLDEPTDGVDPRGRAEIRDFLCELRSEGKTIFVNSHQLQELELVCDRVAMLQGGEVKFIGTLEEATQRPAEITLLLQGDEAAIRSAVGDASASGWKPQGDSQFELTIAVREQSDVDQLVDALRRAGVSILSLTRARQSLEQAFLERVAGGEN